MELPAAIIVEQGRVSRHCTLSVLELPLCNFEADPIAEVRHVCLGEVHGRILAQVVCELEREHAAVAPVLLAWNVSGTKVLPGGHVELHATVLESLVDHVLPEVL